MTVVVVAAVLVVLIVCGTLVTRWAFKFASSVRADSKDDSIEEEEEEEEPVDPAVLSVRHLDGWDEIFFGGRRYRKCLKWTSLRANTTNGWLRYPEGTPLASAGEWLKVDREYERRLANDESSPVAVAARRAWGEAPEAETISEAHVRQRVDPLDEHREVRRREEEALDRRVEEALLETKKVNKL